MKKILILFLLGATMSASRAQVQTTAVTGVPDHFIELTGVAEREIIPDEIFIKITIKEKYVNKEKITIESQEERMKTAFREIGINLEDLYIMDVNAGFAWIRRRSQDMLIKKDYTLKVNSAGWVGKVFQKLDELEIDDASILKVDHSKIDSIRREIRIMAVKAAKEKADYLLNAIGEQTGKAMEVKELGENEGYFLKENIVANDSYKKYEYGDKVQTELQFQKIVVRSAMYVKFQIR